jgi:hypothetical protein
MLKLENRKDNFKANAGVGTTYNRNTGKAATTLEAVPGIAEGKWNAEKRIGQVDKTIQSAVSVC